MFANLWPRQVFTAQKECFFFLKEKLEEQSPRSTDFQPYAFVCLVSRPLTKAYKHEVTGMQLIETNQYLKNTTQPEP